LAPEQGRAFALGLSPALFVLAAITLGPAIYLIVTSLTPLDPVHPLSATDFSDPARNYRALMADGQSLNSLWAQARLSAATVGAQLAIGLGVALLLNAGSRLLEAARTPLILPMVLPPIVVALLWKVIFTPDISLLHQSIPTTEALFSAALPSHPEERHEEIILSGEVPSPLNARSGCRFHPRCPHAMPRCAEEEPVLSDVEGRHVSCHLYESAAEPTPLAISA
jgi:oligopeptide/dipeptide ABC transporter ATP-binding protein